MKWLNKGNNAALSCRAFREFRDAETDRGSQSVAIGGVPWGEVSVTVITVTPGHEMSCQAMVTASVDVGRQILPSRVKVISTTFGTQ